MRELDSDLGVEQLKFLGVLKILGGTASVNILDALAPLTAGQLINLLKKSTGSGLLQHDESETFYLGTLPKGVIGKIDKLNSKKNVSDLVDAIYAKKIDKELRPRVLINILERSGKIIEASKLEFNLSEVELRNGNTADAQKALSNSINRLIEQELDSDASSMFVQAAMRFSDICCELSLDTKKLFEILNTALGLAIQLGDKRSIALISLHIGRCKFFRMDDDYLKVLSAGIDRVHELGDEEILAQSAKFIGLFYFAKGQFKEVIKSLEYLEYSFGRHEEVTPQHSYMLFSYSALYLGQFHRALGLLDSKIRMAEERSDKALPAVLRGILGTALIMVKKYSEAEFHLNLARQELECNFNALGYNHSGGGLAYLYFLKGDLQKSYEILCDTVEEVSKAGFRKQYVSPWIYEMLYEFHRSGFAPIPYLNFADNLNEALKGFNVHLRGVALRLKVQQRLDQDDIEGEESIMADLQASRSCLELSGNHIQLGKTILDMGRFELLRNNKEKATEYIREAWDLVGGYAQEFFPAPYKAMLPIKQDMADAQDTKDIHLKQYFEEMNSIISSLGQQEILNKVIISTNRFLGAERGGFFWFSEGKYTKKPELRAATNLTKIEAASSQFNPYMECVLKSFRTKKPLVARNVYQKDSGQQKDIRSVLCFPIEVHGTTQGVLYHDSSYIGETFDTLESMVALLGKYASGIIDFILTSIRIKEEDVKLYREQNPSQQGPNLSGFVAQSQVMKKQIKMAERVVRTDTSVLLLGETGTGKGTFARWLHEKSHRAESPFVIVDCTSIPEHLVESELFGHEKGAFTGADRQKLGRLEMAHKGTLFLDEVGELPLNLQAKLLKAIEEKVFIRIGSVRVIKSDFRLIAATNRNLENAVTSGRFREDLYYRLNIFPILMPALRERGEDIVTLARYFIELHAKHYGKYGLELSKNDEIMLTEYSWPGNVRELRNVIERAVILSSDTELNIPLLSQGPHSIPNVTLDDMPSLAEFQRRYIEHVFEYTKGRIGGPGGAADILDMKRTSLYSRMRSLGMKKP